MESLYHSRILVVDDEILNTQLVEGFLTFAGYKDIKSVTDSSKVYSTIATYQPDIVLLDLRMPKPDGYEILEELKQSNVPGYFLPVLVFTADNTPEAKKRALALGASDFLTKPGDAQEILLRVHNFLVARRMHLELHHYSAELEDRVRARTVELSLARREAIEALARAAEFRDDSTGEHTHRVGELSASIAAALGESKDMQDALRLVAPLHDVGKIGLPDSILLKPGPLDQEELEIMRRHTITGSQVFEGIESPLMNLARDIALCHHERWDGSGYPNRVAGEAIPLAARIVSVADVYDALVHARPYKKAWPHEEAMAEIRSQSGKQFDPRVVDAFLSMMAVEQHARAA